MPAVTFDFYSNTYIGESVLEAEFPRYEARAEDVINQLIRHREVPARFQTLYQKAICAQIEYYAINGIDLAAGGISADGFTVGKVSVNGGTSGAVGATTMVAPAARAYLEQTGLMSPAVGVLDASPKPWGWY